MATEVSKKALVRLQVGPLQVYSRVVEFESETVLVPAIRAAFPDVLEASTINANLHIQIKDTAWGGEFVDVKEDQLIADHSVLNVTVLQAQKVGSLNIILRLLKYAVARVYQQTGYRFV